MTSPPRSYDLTGRRPAAVEIAFWIAAVVPPLATVLNVAAFVVVKRAVDNVFGTTGGDAQASMVELRDKVNGPLLGFFIFYTVAHLLLSALWILLGLKLRGGRHSARITLTVFASVWALSSLVALIQGDTQDFMTGNVPPFFEFPSSYLVLDYTRSALALLAMATFIPLVFLSPSNRYFEHANVAPGKQAARGSLQGKGE
ncbi:hypothetical protein GCM10029976_012260 [Kribbella albertanoniae]|uniref:Uncharacterized protein n=1 Tax=Kribbella albertanoniae TaxID=1266829 RepID=A0A4V2XNE8_9ACTN|nr:hypothetical protein [Kribbella albertanoniae]TDC17916.1 hypothetical protein E1261_36155 [Kribbella albertanoniae]